jgi:hypothetical protein
MGHKVKRTSKFGHFMILKGINILSSFKLKPIIKIKDKIFNIPNKNFKKIPKSLKNEV